MSDNVAVTAGVGTTIAADEVVDGTLGTVKVQYVKIMDGTLDGTTKAAVGANGLAVAVASGGIASGAVASGAIASGAVASGAIASGAIAAGAIAAGATSIAENEDVASADGDRGVKILFKRLDTPANASGTDGDYEQPQMSAGRVWCSSVITGTVAVTKSGTWDITNAGTFAVQVDGAALTSLQLIDDTVYTDDAAFTPGTSKIIGVGFEADETATDSVDEGDIGAARMTLDRKQIVTTQVHTSGGESSLSALSTAAVYTAEVKASAGQIYGVEIFNKGSAAVYARLYNQTGAPASTDGANIIWRGIVPGSTTGAGFVKGWPNGKICSTGIGIRVSGAIADNDTTALAANEVTINVGFK